MDQHTLYLLVFLSFAVIDVYGLKTARRVYWNDDSKIVGGTQTTIQEHPYQAYLILKQAGTGDYYECGGSIATRRCILTAAHCLTGMESVTVRVGSTYASSGGMTYNSRMLIRHPRYNASTDDYDVGVIKLFNRLVIDGTNTTTIDFPPSGCAVSPGTNLTVTGWGDTSENGQDSDVLRVVTINSISTEQCRRTYSDLTPRMICAGVPEGGKDTCQGDSGGPLVVTGTKTQVGIVSFGYGCARPNTPGVYTNVCNSDIQKFIKRMGCA